MDSRRAEVIRLGVEAYINVVGMRHAKYVANMIREMTKVEFNNGNWRSGQGHVKIRFPQELFLCLRAVLPRYQVFPNFGDEEEDIQFMIREFPDLVGGKRKNKRKFAQSKITE